MQVFQSITVPSPPRSWTLHRQYQAVSSCAVFCHNSPHQSQSPVSGSGELWSKSGQGSDVGYHQQYLLHQYSPVEPTNKHRWHHKTAWLTSSELPHFYFSYNKFCTRHFDQPLYINVACMCTCMYACMYVCKLLNFNRNQLSILTGLFTGHCHLKGHLFKLGLVDSPECDRCKQASETASHVLGDCEALAALRFRYLGYHFMKPGDF